jgi:hypothetical protein
LLLLDVDLFPDHNCHSRQHRAPRSR